MRQKSVLFATSLATLFALSLGPTTARSAPALAEQVAKAYGIDRFDTIDAIKFTFNIQKGDVHVKREWTWEPGTHKVSFHGKGAAGDTITFTYDQSMVDTTNADMKFVDPRFVNDQYWFLFPFHLKWDDMATIEATGQDSLPMGSGMADHLVVSYPKAGGYSPGDMYELFIGPDHMITHWIFRPGGSTTDQLPFSWSGNRTVGPIVVSTEHLSPDGSFHLYFTDVAVRLKGKSEWISG